MIRLRYGYKRIRSKNQEQISSVLFDILVAVPRLTRKPDKGDTRKEFSGNATLQELRL
jgi:hypothetical protein